MQKQKNRETSILVWLCKTKVGIPYYNKMNESLWLCKWFFNEFLKGNMWVTMQTQLLFENSIDYMHSLLEHIQKIMVK